MKPNHRKVSFKALHLDERGYGPDGQLTRQHWQDQCAETLLIGRKKFNAWQDNLIQRESITPHPIGSYEWEVRRGDSSEEGVRHGWSDISFCVVDLSNRVIESECLNGIFENYRFRTGVLFLNVVFKGGALFNSCIFEREAYFLGCQFEAGSFTSCEFMKGAIFDDSKFSRAAWFSSTTFRGGASFKNVEFQTDALFTDTRFISGNFDGAIFRENADFSGNTVHNNNELQTFGPMSFSGCHFFKVADFSNREFKGRTIFGISEGCATQFDEAPLFHNCILHQDTTFSDAIFSTATMPRGATAKAYNTLRHAMSQQQSTREEQRFLRLELDAERAAAPQATRWIYAIYKKVANYGFSIWSPAFFLILIPAVIAGSMYGIAASRHQCPELLSSNCQFNTSLLIEIVEFSLLQTLPLPGLDRLSELFRLSLFRDSQLTLVTALITMQKMFALLGWFFVALALRNLFKMK